MSLTLPMAMLRSLSKTLFAAAFATVSFLGHGGLHLIPGGDACHLEQHHAAADDHAHHAHSHGACSHSHHRHSNEPLPTDAPAPADHDHDTCLVCQWHAQGQINVINVIVPVAVDGEYHVTLLSPQVASSFRLTTRFTRGPPVLV